MFSQTVEYALRAVVYLAGQDQARTTHQIAEVTKAPSAYLAKVLQSLNRAGLVRSQRGLYGGFSLGKPSSVMTIWEVVQAVEPIQRIQTCPLELESHKTKLCPLHKKLDDALATIQKAFGETTLADILAEPTTSKPLCPFPYSREEKPNSRISLK
jgi:Rrf2 family transcriptional regulator, nitric oxide-sensitive transcriptional repressor